MSELSSSRQVVPGVTKSQPGFMDAMHKVQTEFDSMFDTFYKKVQKHLGGGDNMIKKCGLIMEAVPLWDFAKTPWVHETKDDGDAEVVAVMKTVEQFPLQFDNSKSRGLRVEATSEWQNEDIKRKVKELAEGFKNESYQAKLDDASRVLAHSMLCNAILASTDGQDEAKWPKICEQSSDVIQRTLRVPTAQLGVTLFM